MSVLVSADVRLSSREATVTGKNAISERPLVVELQINTFHKKVHYIRILTDIQVQRLCLT